MSEGRRKKGRAEEWGREERIMRKLFRVRKHRDRHGER